MENKNIELAKKAYTEIFHVMNDEYSTHHIDLAVMAYKDMAVPFANREYRANTEKWLFNDAMMTRIDALSDLYAIFERIVLDEDSDFKATFLLTDIDDLMMAVMNTDFACIDDITAEKVAALEDKIEGKCYALADIFAKVFEK